MTIGSRLSLLALASGIVAGGLLVLDTAPAQAAKCVKAGGTATGVTRDLAAFLAEAAMKNSMTAQGLTQKGKVNLVCAQELLLQSCTATVRACK